MEIENFGVDFKESKLINGVKLYSFYKPNSPIYFRVYFYAGSQFDGDKLGLAHFCEHMMISGTEKYPTKVVLNEKIQELGAKSNAFTYTKNLWLTIDLADKIDLPEMFEKVDQILNKSIFSIDIMAKERGAILAEQTRKTSNPAQDIYDLQNSLLFQGTNIENPVLGSDESVRNITQEDLLNYKDKYLTNGKVAYFISGDFDEQVVINSLNEINKSRIPIDFVETELPIIRDKKELFKNISQPEQNYISLSTRISPILNITERVSSDIFSAILGQGNTSKLYKSLRNDNGLVYSVQSNISSNSEFASLTINTSCKVKDTKEVVNIIRNEFAEIIRVKINDKDLERAKKNILRNIKFDSEISAFWVSTSLMKELTNQLNPILPDKYIDAVKSATTQDINSFIKKYIASKELLLAGIGDFTDLNHSLSYK